MDINGNIYDNVIPWHNRGYITNNMIMWCVCKMACNPNYSNCHICRDIWENYDKRVELGVRYF